MLIPTEIALRACLKARKIFSRNQPYVFLAAMPKSASTFLFRVLVEITGYEHAYFASAYRNIEQELYIPRLIDAYNVATVTQQHMRANDINLEIMKEFGIRPVVLVRDILDILVSIRDHLLHEQPDNLPGLYVPDNFVKFNNEQQYDFVTTYAAPWLVSFYASWAMASEESKIDMIWLHYDEVTGNSAETVQQILHFLDLEGYSNRIEPALQSIRGSEQTRIRLNKGVSGRGTQELSADQVTRVRQLALTYPDIDFTRVGLQR